MAFPTIPNASGTSGVNGTVTVSAVTGVAIGNLLYAWICVRSDQATGISPPSGWTLIDTYAPGNNCFSLFSKVATAGDVGASFVFTWSFTSSGLSAGTAVVFRIPDSDQTIAPVLSANHSGGGTTSPVGTTITPFKNALLIQLIGTINASGTAISTTANAIANNNPSWTSLFNTSAVTGNNGNRAAGAVAYANQGTAGATGAGSATFSISTSNYSFLQLAIFGPNIQPASIVIAMHVNAMTFRKIILAVPFVLATTINAPIVSAIVSKWQEAVKHVASWIEPNKN